MTVDPVGNIYVANNGDGTIVKITPEGVKSVYASGLNAPTDAKIGPDGVLYVSVEADNALYRITGANQVELLARGIANSPQGIRYGADGKLYLANGDSSLRVKDTQNQVTVLATGLGSPRGLDVAANGDVYVANNSGGSLIKVSGTVKTNFATGLSSPYGVAIDGSGDIHVTESGRHTIRQYQPDGTLRTQLESALAAPAQVTVAQDGRVWLRNNNFISVVEAGTARIVLRDFTADMIVPAPGGSDLLVRKGSSLYRLNTSGVLTLVNTLPNDTSHNLATDQEGNIYYTDPAALKIFRQDSAGTSTIYADLPFATKAIALDANGVVYLLNQSGTRLFKIVAGNGVEVALAGQTLYNLTRSSDGRIMYWGNANRLTLLDPATSAASTITPPTSGSWFAVDANNRGYLVLGQDLIYFDNNGNRTGQLYGFTNPKDLIWTGSELRFFDSTNRVYRYTPGSNPEAIHTIAQAAYLAPARH